MSAKGLGMPGGDFYIDDFGYLWNGPREGGQGFRWLRFDGAADNGDPIWIWQSYDPPPDLFAIPREQARRVMLRHVAEAAQRSGR